MTEKADVKHLWLEAEREAEKFFDQAPEARKWGSREAFMAGYIVGAFGRNLESDVSGQPPRVSYSPISLMEAMGVRFVLDNRS